MSALLARGLNERRVAAVEAAYTLLRSVASVHGAPVTIATAVQVFDPFAAHPDVKSRRYTTQQVAHKTLAALAAAAGAPVSAMGQLPYDAVLPRDAFDRYYTHVSAGIDVDDAFEALLSGCWHLHEATAGGGSARTHTAVLVTRRSDGHKHVVRIPCDRFLSLDDEAGIRARLAALGVTDVASVSLDFAD